MTDALEFFLVGPAGFEPTTSSPPVKRATRLRYGPNKKINVKGSVRTGRESSVSGVGLASGNDRDMIQRDVAARWW